MNTVATHRLPDATHQACLTNQDGFCEHHPWISPVGDVPDVNGRVEHHYNPESPHWVISMGSITVDGLFTRFRGGHGYYIFNFRDDLRAWCDPDENGFCRCHPVKYAPLAQSQGDICEPCWLKRGKIYGVKHCECSYN